MNAAYDEKFFAWVNLTAKRSALSAVTPRLHDVPLWPCFN